MTRSHRPRLSLSLVSLAVISLAALGGCRGSGDGHVVVEHRDVAAFTAIETTASVPVDVAFADDANANVDVTIDDNLRDLINTEVRDDGTLVVSTSDVLFPASSSVVTVRLPSRDSLSLTSGGSAGLSFAGDAPHLDVTLRGSGAVTLAGSSDTLDATSTGSAPIDAHALTADDAVLTSSGSGSITAHVTGTIAITLTGSGDVRWTGPATATTADDTGSGSIVHE